MQEAPREAILRLVKNSVSSEKMRTLEDVSEQMLVEGLRLQPRDDQCRTIGQREG